MKKFLNYCLFALLLVLLVSTNVSAQSIPSGYMNLIKTYRDTLYNGTYDEAQYGVFEYNLVQGESAMLAYGYGFDDINNDGIPEMVVGWGDEQIGYEFAALYTLENDSPKQLLKAITERGTNNWTKIRIMLDVPEDPRVSNSINYYGNSETEDLYSTTFYKLNGTNLDFSVSFSSKFGGFGEPTISYESTDPNNPRQTEIPSLPQYLSTATRGISMTSFANFPTVPDEGPAGSIYRIYNPNTSEHLYTASYGEAVALTTQYGWKGEGIGWTAPTEPGTPVYRLYNASIDDHLYTTDENEVMNLTTYQNWAADNNGQPVFYSGGEVPIYRLYNPTSYRHLLTRDQGEYTALGEIGWQQEGVGLNGVS